MSLDLGGPALEIAIALAFVFFLLSLLVSALNEWIAGLLNLRAKTLKRGLQGMVGDHNVVETLLKHALVRTDSGRRPRDPSYISPRNFALAFKDVVAVGSAAPDLAQQLRALTGSSTAAMPDAATLESWFDESMNRVGGWYKRRAQIVTILLAVAITIGLNVSALRIAEKLSNEPTVRAAVVTKAEKAGGASADLTKAGEAAEDAVDQLSALKLPIFWAEGNAPWEAGNDLWIGIVGWGVTIVAISFGAPFWFDALGKLSNLRMAGKKPEETTT